MITVYSLRNRMVEPKSLEAVSEADVAGGLWIDILTPTLEEEKGLEHWLGIDIPTKDEMREIEDTSRFYSENGALYLTITVASATDTDHPVNVPITFILTERHLITVRYSNPRPFSSFADRCIKQMRPFVSNMDVFLGLVEGVQDRIADLLEILQQRLDDISFLTFNLSPDNLVPLTPQNKPTLTLKEIVQSLGRHHFFSVKLRESLLTLVRMMTYLRQNTKEWHSTDNLSHIMRGVERDSQSLVEYSVHINQEINFLLDSTLGLISDRQNTVIQIFSIVAVLFLPPTLVGTLYGMNFKYMPELDWTFGYPFALILMLLSGIIPYLIIKRKGLL